MDHVDLLGRANRGTCAATFGDHEATLVEGCARLSFREAVSMVDYWRQRVDADGADDDTRRDVEGAAVHASETIDGNVVINGTLDPLGGAAVLTELNRLERVLYLTDEADGVVRTNAQRRATRWWRWLDGRRPRPPTGGHRHRCSACSSVTTASPGCASSPTDR